MAWTVGQGARPFSASPWVLLGVCLATPVFGQARIALVIGNSVYRYVPGLPNTTNDAGDMVASLTRLGFAVSA